MKREQSGGIERGRGSIVAWVVVLLNESHIIGKVRNVGGTIKIFSDTYKQGWYVWKRY